MKVKNIVFFGFAAAILSGVANADPLQVASTAYVTSQLSAKADASTTYTKSEVDGLLDDKQDTISDLSTIRSGAAAGATALQQADLAGYATTEAMNAALEDYTTTADLNTALAGKQATISDLETIRSGAAAGATALQQADLAGYATTEAMNTALEDYTTTADLNTALAGKQATISDLETIRSGAAAGATAVQPATLTTTLGDYATTSAMNTALAAKADDSDLTTLEGRVDDVEDTIGTGSMTVNGANQATIVAAINALDNKTNGMATDQNLTDLQNNVTALSNKVGSATLATTAQTVTAAVNELKGDLAAVLPAANTCTSSSGHCVLSIDTSTGTLSWVDVTTPWVTVE